jgi:hypothetical protein
LIRLTFRALRGETTVISRAAYFRICTDSTLRGPDNSIAASYIDRVWHLGNRHYRGFDCTGPIFLRVTNCDGLRQQLGPFDSLRAVDGALYSHETCLGTYLSGWTHGNPEDRWREVVLLPAELAAA